jgi:hypothetical protein
MENEKSTHKMDEPIKKNVVFCSECGEELTIFGLSGEKIDLRKIKDRHKHCMDIGKFKGDKCAMLFIADDSDELILPHEDD